MSEIEKMKRYISKPQSGEFQIGTRYQMCLGEMLELSHMSPIDAVCLAFDYGRAKGYRAAKAEGRAQA